MSKRLEYCCLAASRRSVQATMKAIIEPRSDIGIDRRMDKSDLIVSLVNVGEVFAQVDVKIGRCYSLAFLLLLAVINLDISRRHPSLRPSSVERNLRHKLLLPLNDFIIDRTG